MRYSAAAYSAKGIREINEDSFIIAEKINEFAKSFTEFSVEGEAKGSLFFCVADGMGGQGSGEKASHLVVSELLESEKSVQEFDSDKITAEILKIHEKVISSNSKMGSTLTGIVLQEKNAGLINLGDSRTYRLRNGVLLKMSNDDSLRRFCEDAPSNIITNGIGAGLKNISVNSRFSDKIAVCGDRFLMCSDGVYGFLTDEKIEELLNEKTDARDVVSKIVKLALTNQTDDNCTAVILDIKE